MNLYYDKMEEYYKNSEDNDKSLLEKIGDILSYINPFSENFFGYKIINMQKELETFLFIPDEEHLNLIPNTVNEKFAVVDTIKGVINELKIILSNANPNTSLNVDVESKYFSGSVKVIDLSWYQPFKEYGDLVLTGFIYIMFVWRVFVHLPNIISGTGGDIHNISSNFRGGGE